MLLIVLEPYQNEKITRKGGRDSKRSRGASRWFEGAPSDKGGDLSYVFDELINDIEY